MSPAPDAGLLDDLVAETAALADQLGLGVLRTPGAVGVRSPTARLPCWVPGDADLAALLVEVAPLALPPDLFLHEGVERDLAPLRAAGWGPRERVRTVRCDLTAAADVDGEGAELVAATVADLPDVRVLHAEAFGGRADDHLPDEVLALPGLRLLLLRDAGGALLGTVGLRRRPRGTLLFGLAVRADVQGGGHGAALVRAGVRLAQRDGAGRLVAEVDADRLALWVRTGFVPQAAWERWAAPGQP